MTCVWQKNKLSEISKISYGYTEKATDKPVGPKFLRITDIQNDKVDWENVPYCVIDKIDFEKHQLLSGDLVFARTGATTGKSFLVTNPPKAVAASYLIRLRINEDQVLPEFLCYYFQSDEYWQNIKKGISGSAQGGFNASKLADLTFSWPPLPEQQRIVALLDQAFAAIDTAKVNVEKKLQNAREIFNGYLNSIFDPSKQNWQIRKLEEFFDITSSKRVYEADWKREGVPFYRAREIVKLSQNGYVDNELFISEEMFNLYSEKYGYPKENDIMVTGVGTLGICYVVKRDDKFYFKDGNIIWLKTKGEISSRFVEYAFKSELLRKQIDDSVGATVGTYTIIKAKNTRIPVPPLQDQLHAVDLLDEMLRATKELENICQRKVNSLNELKSSVMHKAFSGEL